MPFSELDWEGMDPPGPVTKSSEERGFERDSDADEERGESDELDGEAGDKGHEVPEGHESPNVRVLRDFGVFVVHGSAYCITARRSAPFERHSRTHRSPTAASRPAVVRMVKSRGDTPSSISAQVTGIETPANALARAL